MTNHKHVTSSPTDVTSATAPNHGTGVQAHPRENDLPDDWWTAGGYDTDNGRIEYDWSQTRWRAVLPDNTSAVFPTEAQAVDHLNEVVLAIIRRYFPS